MRSMEAKVPAFDQPHSIREQLGGPAVEASGYPGFKMSM